MMKKEVKVDEFEYKGRLITVLKDKDSNHFFRYKEGNKDITLSFKELDKFIKGAFSHTTINNNPVDMIERSVKILDLLYDVKDLKSRIKKYN